MGIKLARLAQDVWGKVGNLGVASQDPKFLVFQRHAISDSFWVINLQLAEDLVAANNERFEAG
ncbi:hypothetical protein CTA1_10885 [Colletotrichum tanaceti]|uniref:Uncharacterized protein n=1 Tax=Colletotrichum tanaceti TaxID=1306861 RepID=A0A4U6XD84_9PEZI|nr:hypothetical protein CTA1_10885 [Colletotrichum tanaceti]